MGRWDATTRTREREGKTSGLIQRMWGKFVCCFTIAIIVSIRGSNFLSI